MDAADAAQQRWADLLFPTMLEYAEAVCLGSADDLDRSAAELSALVRADADPPGAADFLGSTLVAVVSTLWDEARSAGDRVPGPPVGLEVDESLRRTQDLLESLGAHHGAAQTLMARGRQAVGAGDLRLGTARLERARALLARLGDADALRLRAIATGMLRRALGDPASAVAAFQEAAERSAALRRPDSQAACLAEVAAVHEETGDVAAAARSWTEASRQAFSAGMLEESDRWGVSAADAALAAGREAVNSSRWEEAARFFDAARVGYLARRPQCAEAAANAALHLGITAFSRNHLETALAWFRTAEGEYTDLSNRAGLGMVHFAWGNAFVTRGDVESAEPILRTAMEELVGTGQREAAAGCLRLLGAVAYHRGDVALAEQMLARAAAILGDPESEILVGIVGGLGTLQRQGSDAVGPDAVGPDAVGPDAVGPDAAGPDAPQWYAQLRERLLTEAETGKAAASALMEVHALARTGRLDEARTAAARFESLLAEASVDPRSEYLAAGLGFLPAMARTAIASGADDAATVELGLTELRRGMLGAGAALQAARVGVLLGQHCLAAGRPLDALDHVVPALFALSAQEVGLPDSRERRQWAEVIADAGRLALEAADEVRDRRLVAELLEVLRGHAMPEPILEPSGPTRSLVAILGSLAEPADRGLPSGADDSATRLAPAARIRMPWGTVALEGYRDAARSYLRSPSHAVVVALVVAR